MVSSVLRRLAALAVPEGVILAAALVLAGWDRTAADLDRAVPFYPYAVAAAGLLLAWRFGRSRILFALVVLALADRALALVGGSGVFHTVAFLLPLNLTVLALIDERGLVSRVGLVRLGWIGVQAAVVLYIARTGGGEVVGLLDRQFLPEAVAGWTRMGDPALVVLAAGAATLAARVILHPNPIDRGYTWALVATAAGLAAPRGTVLPTFYIATAGLILVVAVVEDSFALAYRDGLTGLPSRRALEDALRRLGPDYAIAMVDVDHFKKFNDTYGHDVGDQVLRMVAARLGGVAGGGKPFRYGGEEFAVVFPGRSVADALPHLEAVREAIERSRFALRGKDRPKRRPKQFKRSSNPKRVTITVSIGVAQPDGRHAKPDDVIHVADEALYRAKRAGRNRVKA